MREPPRSSDRPPGWRVGPWRKKALWLAGYAAATVVGLAIVFGPNNRVWDGGFMQTSFPGTSTGDHVQLTYYFWLWWHAITTWSHFPWVDPFQFAATGHITHQPFGWPLVLVSLPVHAVFGPLAAFNAVFYTSFFASAGATFLWVRRLGVARIAAAVAGFAFAFAPFRLVQRWHINALLAFLMPLCLYFAERALRGPERRARAAGWGCAASFISLTASGEMHLVAYFTPVLILYVLARSRGVDRQRLIRLALPAAVGLLGAIVFLSLTYSVVHAPSRRAGVGISADGDRYAPRPADIVRRGPPSERAVYPGAVTAVLAAIGAIVAYRRRELRGLGILLVVLVVGSYALAILPSTGELGLRLYMRLPVLSSIRVPGRIVIIAALALAGLAGLGVSHLARPRRWMAGGLGIALMLLVLWDGASMTRNITADADDGSLLHGVPRGASVLDLPPFDAGHFGGSRYMLQIIRKPGPRVGGYSVFATTAAHDAQQLTTGLTDSPIDECRWLDVSRKMKFEYIAVHQALFGPYPQWLANGLGLIESLDASPAFARVSETDDVVVYEFTPARLRCNR